MTDDLDAISARVGRIEDLSAMRVHQDQMARLAPARLGDAGMPPEPTVGASPFDVATLIAPGAVIASAVPFLDAGGFYTATDMEGALQELALRDIGYLAHGNTGATETFNALTGWHSATLNAATVTFTFNGATSGLLAAMVLELAQDATGGRLVTWPGSVVWPGGVAPTLSTAPNAVDVLTFFSRDGGTTWFGFATGGSDLTIKDEGGSLATAATSIDFVGAGVVASGAAAAKTVTIPGTPAGAAGGDLSGTYPNPSVANDSHSHTSATLPAGDHEHVVGETFSGDGATTAFEIANEPMDSEAVAGYVAGLRVALTVSGGMNTTVTFAVAPASGTDNIVIDYPAVAA